MLADGSGLVSNHQFYLASRAYANGRPQIVQAIVDELARLDRWAEGNPRQVATILAPQIGLDIEVAELAASRFAYGIRPIDAAIMVAQQRIADTFHELKLIPRAIRVADALPAGASADPASAR